MGRFYSYLVFVVNSNIELQYTMACCCEVYVCIICIV